MDGGFSQADGPANTGHVPPCDFIPKRCGALGGRARQDHELRIFSKSYAYERSFSVKAVLLTPRWYRCLNMTGSFCTSGAVEAYSTPHGRPHWC